ncbi:hypothetical protein LSH36_811g01022 [Paralvinella palmiformis]|uniref:Uncharacterized protein n=1 Tax=Paralvinella palmiformis TaxID=53620 RepID=A0AAD9J1A5_9ANNE|nr:hypothetical protein LSH36_811g01022 [Paralvinella palmiformis]
MIKKGNKRWLTGMVKPTPNGGRGVELQSFDNQLCVANISTGRSEANQLATPKIINRSTTYIRQGWQFLPMAQAVHRKHRNRLGVAKPAKVVMSMQQYKLGFDVDDWGFMATFVYREGVPLKAVSRATGIPRSTLMRHRNGKATNIARATGFNRFKVGEFFYAYRSLIEERSYPLSSLWNMDKIGISNVHKPGPVVATKGHRQVGKITS